MVIHCPKCLRKLPESGSAADAPAFCMFCGQKLRSTDSGTTKPVMPDPSEAFGVAGSGGETMAFTPASPHSDPSPNDTSLTEASADASGTTINSIAGFVFRRFLGAGGMGTVYEAEAEASGQRVAIKLLSARLAANPSSVERFRQEGRVASQIMHPRCVFVLRADTEAGRPYIIMELMPGQTLKDMVDQKGPLHFSAASDRILDVIDGLVEAHRLGVIHRDVKPSNCFLTEDDRVKIGDFGLSKSLTTEGDEEAGGKQLTSSGTFLGTVMYASPEQIRGEPVSYDSDVYAVCGTLYYLLTGKAPFQHESLTASLAKAVSEPPPPIRDKFPSVPKELERVIVRGLDRDRTRRYQSLTELRDALVDLQIEKQKPARPRAIILAYLIDSLLLTIATFPLEVLRQALFSESIFTPKNSLISADFAYNSLPTMCLTGMYFIISEGLFATTIGKRLLRLRVYRLGEVGPPGVLHAGLRFLVFWSLWLIVYTAPEWGLESIGSAGAVIGGGVSVLGIAILCLQFRGTAKGWRGVHDFAAGTRVVQRPRPPHRPRLISRFANPLDRLQPTSGPMLPIVGSFTISGKLCDLPDGGEVWSGDDRSLGRRILLRLLPPGVNDIEALDQASETPRPTRLRTIGHGAYGATTTTGNLERRAWMAYVAPAGAPLMDVVSKEAPLKWIDARTVLEQLTDELLAQTEMGEFQPACIEQVWVEPGGRLQLLDFPLPSGRLGTLKPENTCPAADPLDLVRQTAALALEGEPRTTMARLQAPIPPHATRITDKLFHPDNPIDLPRLKSSLAENLVQAPEMTGASRAAHLSVLTMMLAVPFIMMYSFAGLFSLVMAVTGAGQAENVRYLKSVLADPVHKAELEDYLNTRLSSASDNEKILIGKINAAISPEKLSETFAYLDSRYEERKGREELLLVTLNRPERFLMTRVLRNIDKDPISGQNSRSYFTSMELLGSRRITPTVDQNVIRRAAAMTFAVIIVTLPLIWAVMSFLFRGGLSMKIAGMTLVTANGNRAARWRCFLRELIVWFPIISTLLVTLFLQYEFPGWILQRSALWLVAILMLPLYAVIALREPTRPPQDRLVGTYLVPE